MTIPRIKADETHAIAYTGDPGVVEQRDVDEWVPSWVPSRDDVPDVVHVHPLGGPALRRAWLDDDPDWAIVRDSVARVNNLAGEAALAEAACFPVGPFMALVGYVVQISAPVEERVKEAPAGETKSPDDGG